MEKLAKTIWSLEKSHFRWQQNTRVELFQKAAEKSKVEFERKVCGKMHIWQLAMFSEGNDFYKANGLVA